MNRVIERKILCAAIFLLISVFNCYMLFFDLQTIDHTNSVKYETNITSAEVDHMSKGATWAIITTPKGKFYCQLFDIKIPDAEEILTKLIKTNQKVTITASDSKNLMRFFRIPESFEFFNTENAVDVRSDEVVYCDLDDYNSDKFVMRIIFGVFSGISILCFIVSCVSIFQTKSCMDTLKR